MVSARVLLLVLSISALILRTGEARAAERREKGSKREAPNSTSSDEMAYGGGDETTTSSPTPTPTTTPTTTTTVTTSNSSSVTNPEVTTVSSSPTMSNYSTTVNSTASSTANSTANSTQPPYVDQYGNNLPKVVNGTQYYPESTDMMDLLPVVPLDEDGSANGNNVWVVYRIPAGGVAPTQIEPSQAGNVVNNRYEIEENEEQTTTTGCPSTQPDFQAAQQPQQPQQLQGYYVVVRPVEAKLRSTPVEAYQQDYYRMGSSDGAQIKPLDKFFYA